MRESEIVVQEIDGLDDIVLTIQAKKSKFGLAKLFINTGNRFDLKIKIRNLSGNRIENYDPVSGFLFPFDIWSNFQWGFTGAEFGGSDKEVSLIAQIAQLLHYQEMDPVHDKAAIQMGRDLWKSHKMGLSIVTFVGALRARKTQLGRRP